MIALPQARNRLWLRFGSRPVGRVSADLSLRLLTKGESETRRIGWPNASLYASLCSRDNKWSRRVSLRSDYSACSLWARCRGSRTDSWKGESARISKAMADIAQGFGVETGVHLSNAQYRRRLANYSNWSLPSSSTTRARGSYRPGWT